jgi:hypothetical protein
MNNEDKPKPRSATTGTLVGTRFQPMLLDALDMWRKEQNDLPTRPEAVRRLVELGMNYKFDGNHLVQHQRPAK